MIIYLLKSIACLLLLLLVHRVLLQREVLHRFNRFFLLFSVVASFLIPLYTIEVPEEIVAAPIEVNSEPIYFEAVPSDVISEPVYFGAASQDSNQEQVFAAVPESQFNWEYLLFGIYGLISLVFLYRFGRNIKVLVNKIQGNIKINYRGQTLVLLKEDSLPFSFLKYIFVAESDLENGKFTDAIFTHECTHIEEKHSWDNLFIEALLVPLWFHPGLHWAKASIKLNHEFIADEIALRSTPIEKYESQLLAMMLSEQKYGLASSLNFSLTKKRFEMMKRKSKNSSTWIKVFALVPVLGALVYFFSERVAAKQDLENPESEVYVNTANTAYNEVIDFTFELKANGDIFSDDILYNLESAQALIRAKKAVKQDLKINLVITPDVSMGILSDFHAILRDVDVRRIYYISNNQDGDDTSNGKFGKSDSDRIQGAAQVNGSIVAQSDEKDKYYKNASFFVENEAGDLIAKSYDELSESEKIHLLPPTKAPAKKQPSSSEFEAWKNPKDFALWLDGKVISNSQLENMSISDVVFFFNSFVHLNARSERFPQEHQVHMYSEEAYENAFGAKSGKGNPLDKDDKFYIYPKDKRINFGKPWVKKEKDPVADKKEETADKWPPAVKAAQIKNDLESYIDAYAAYEKLRKQAPHFVNRSKAEQEKLTEMYTELRSMYFQVAFHDKPKVRRAVLPYVPYYKLTSKGEVYYKKGKDLTAEELSIVGPPPPPPTPAELLESYKKVSYQYELMRNKGRNDASLSMEERNNLFLMYNELQVIFLNMGAPERRQVKMVNFPYYRVEENGKNVFKAVSELTPEQRALNNC
ncbi:M56 family metallopeptidase [Algoriphagus winogradskyi]|uniref:Signal transducer regulating beta-lactamase production, contains metallopeptidase domain n=1 Tax=Algoriphagus winogradskyi TaxID=237017 RepID=A0ABY1NY53_9BACT|nr:M56 family metallopeptidase [Algoriphagus winogradskyi]SMP21307.1 Signal transducer regulating beta-lactamase production, contains metallopeptidase domain [Algoriphagus winogradskyi]